MNKILLALCILISGIAHAETEAEKVIREYKDWYNNKHHTMVVCVTFFLYSSKRFENSDTRLSNGLGNVAKKYMDIIEIMGFDKRVTLARGEMFMQDISQNYNYEGSFSVLIAKYQNSCLSEYKSFEDELNYWTNKMDQNK
jgi:hypothetical protein